MEFFWSDVDDAKYFHVLDTGAREVSAVRNPVRIHERIYYDDTVSDAKFKYGAGNYTYCDDKFVKVVVVNKSDARLFEKFIDRIQSRKIHELKIAETFTEFVGENVEDDKISIESTENLLYSYVDAVDTVLDKNEIKRMMHQLMIDAETTEVV